MLGIGSVYGPEYDRMCIGRAITRLGNLVEEERGNFEFGSAAAVNVVYQIAYNAFHPLEFEGLRTAKFSRKLKLLMVQVAVSSEIATSEDEATVRKFLFDSLRHANEIAAEHFEKKGIEYSQANYLALLDAVEAKFGQKPTGG